MTKQPKKIEPAAYSGDDLPKVEFMPEAGAEFVVTPYIQNLTERALAYLNVGYAVHLCGPAGTGKSTLAMHVASQLGRPCTLLHGDDEFKASDLLGRDTGYHRSSTVDNYVSSIVKTEETLSVVWSNNRLTTACQKGHTLIYDEFTRSPATANNPFLSILEEGILNIPSSGKQKGYIKVHDDFRAIFTSNPEEYVGVHKTQDALLDRMITMRLDYQDRETETAIVLAKSRLNAADAAAIVDIVRSIRSQLGGINGPTVRAAIAIARILDFRQSHVDPNDAIFMTTCQDVLCYHTSRHSANGLSAKQVDAIIRSLGQECSSTESVPSDIGMTTNTDQPVTTSIVAVTQSPTSVLQTTASSTTASGTGEEPSPPEESTTRLNDPARDEQPIQDGSARGDEIEKQLLQTATELGESLDVPRIHEEDALVSVVPTSDSDFLPNADFAPNTEVLRNEVARTESESIATSVASPTLPKPPRIDVPPMIDTASPRQMLEAAVTRFLRPPTAPGSIAPPLSRPTTAAFGTLRSPAEPLGRSNGWNEIH